MGKVSKILGVKTPEIPEVPTQAELDAEAEEEARKKRAELQSGRTETFLTRSQNIEAPTQRRRTLVGG